MQTGQRLSAQARRKYIVETVVKLCAEEEPATLTTGRIASRMGVTQGALFRHFASKEEIWEAVTSWVTERIIREIDEAAASANGPLMALEAMFYAHVVFIQCFPGVPRMLMVQLQHDHSMPARRIVRSFLFHYRERVEAKLGEAFKAGKLRPRLDLDAAATQFIGTLQGLVMQAMMVGDMSHMARQAPSALDIYMNGICACSGGDA
ncbi:MAG: TetR/AcrR family transcriptional regulator [Pseudomonadota bacterium]